MINKIKVDVTEVSVDGGKTASSFEASTSRLSEILKQGKLIRTGESVVESGPFERPTGVKDWVFIIAADSDSKHQRDSHRVGTMGLDLAGETASIYVRELSEASRNIANILDLDLEWPNYMISRYAIGTERTLLGTYEKAIIEEHDDRMRDFLASVMPQRA